MIALSARDVISDGAFAHAALDAGALLPVTQIALQVPPVRLKANTYRIESAQTFSVGSIRYA